MLWVGLLLVGLLLLATLGGLWGLRILQRQAIARLPDEEPEAEQDDRDLARAKMFVGGPSSLLHRSEHVTDRHHGGADYTRKICNWQNYVTPSGIVLPTNTDLVESSSPPPGWEGDWDFDLVSEHGPGQAFIREHVKKLPQAGVRHSDYPAWWMNLRVLGTQDGIVPVRSGNSVTWTDAFTGCDLTLSVRANGFDDEFLLKSYSAPTRYRYSLLLAHGLRHEVTADSVRVYDGDELAFIVKAPWARDSSGTDELSSRSIRCWFEAGEPITQGGRTFPTFYKCLDETEFASAVLPVRAGPTTTISGTSAIEDSFINTDTGDASYADNSYGGSPTLAVGGIEVILGTRYRHRRTFMRVATASLPVGTHSALRLSLYRLSNGGSANAGVADFFVCKDAATWVEGTNNAESSQNGSICWNKAQYGTPGVNWPGGVNGGGISGSDYDADASPPNISYDAYTVGADVLITTTLLAAWSQSWKNGTRTNNGIVLKFREGSLAGTTAYFRSTEYASNNPYFEIDYALGIGASILRPAFYSPRAVMGR